MLTHVVSNLQNCKSGIRKCFSKCKYSCHVQVLWSHSVTLIVCRYSGNTSGKIVFVNFTQEVELTVLWKCKENQNTNFPVCQRKTVMTTNDKANCGVTPLTPCSYSLLRGQDTWVCDCRVTGSLSCVDLIWGTLVVTCKGLSPAQEQDFDTITECNTCDNSLLALPLEHIEQAASCTKFQTTCTCSQGEGQDVHLENKL